ATNDETHSRRANVLSMIPPVSAAGAPIARGAPTRLPLSSPASDFAPCFVVLFRSPRTESVFVCPGPFVAPGRGPGLRPSPKLRGGIARGPFRGTPDFGVAALAPDVPQDLV